MIGRRVLLAAPALVPLAALAPLEAGAQVRRNDLDALALPVKQDDTVARGYRRGSQAGASKVTRSPQRTSTSRR